MLQFWRFKAQINNIHVFIRLNIHPLIALNQLNDNSIIMHINRQKYQVSLILLEAHKVSVELKVTQNVDKDDKQ